MRAHIPLIVLSLLAACGKPREIDGSYMLDAQEKEYLSTLQANNCLKREEGNLRDFLNESKKSLNSFQRGDSWKVETKNSDGSAAGEAIRISVWGRYDDREESNVIFLITGEGRRSQFLKIDLPTNSAMIKDLVKKSCAKSIALETSTDSAQVKIEGTRQRASEPNLWTKVNSSYKFKYALPAYFAYYNKVDTIQYTKDDSTRAKDDGKKTTTITQIDDQKLFDGYSSYESAEFCAFTGDPNEVRTFELPYSYRCSSSAQAGPENWKTPHFNLQIPAQKDPAVAPQAQPAPGTNPGTTNAAEGTPPPAGHMNFGVDPE